MNVEAIKKRLQAYYDTATPEQVIAEFEAMGVELADIDEPIVSAVRIEIDKTTLSAYSDSFLAWQDVFTVSYGPEKIVFGEVLSTEGRLTNNYQYAMAA
jgi:hypothetical protein